MAKPSPRTFAPIFALAWEFGGKNSGLERRLGDCTDFALLVTGRKARNNADMLAAIQPCIDAGLVSVRWADFAPKGCPGGKSRSAIVRLQKIALTPSGIVAVAEQGVAVDAERAERAATVRARLLGAIAAALVTATPAEARCAAVAGQLPNGFSMGLTAELLAAATNDQLSAVARSLGAY